MFDSIRVITQEAPDGLTHAEVTGAGLNLSITAPSDEIWRTISTLCSRVTIGG